MKKHSPRQVYRASLVFVAVFFLVVGTVCHWRAFRLQRRAIFDRIDALEKRISDAERAREVAVDAKKDSSPVVDRALSQSDEVRPAVPRPRILGSGRSGKYVYIDVRLPSRQVNRYFLPVDASPRQVKRWIAGLSADVDDDLALFER